MFRSVSTRDRRLLGVALATLGVTPAVGAAQISVQEIAARSTPAVYQVITELGDGTGFLVDEVSGLVVTNAHVTAGQQTVAVKLDLWYKVAGVVVLEDRREDVAVVRINPAAVAARSALRLDQAAADALDVGDLLTVMGYPLGQGVVTTTGIVGRKRQGALITDARVSPGDSGGPMFGPDGSVVGMTTYLAAPWRGGGFGGAIAPSVALGAIARARGVMAGEPPAADSLPVLPTDVFPLAVLERALASADWPVDVYNISDESVGAEFDVRIFTPPLLVRLGHDTLEDLRYWALDAGAYPPVVIVRIQPTVGQSARAFFGNLLLSAAAGATGTPFWGIYEPEAKGRLGAITIQAASGFVRPIQIKRAGAVLQGQPLQVAHVLLSPELFRPGPDGKWQPLILNISDAERGILPWLVPARTMERVFRDFEEYLAR